MSCLSETTVAGFLEHRLSNAERAAVETHVDVCESCRDILIAAISATPLPSAVADEHATLTFLAERPGQGEALAKGTVVGRFVVIELLGAGGMGVVYAAYDPELDRKVALKLLRPRARGERGEAAGDARARLLAEAQAMARISHPNVIAVHDVGTYRDQVFLAMELVEGTTLRRWLAERPRGWRESVDVLLAAGEGLAAAHTAGVVHRDFKPDNVLLCADRGGDARDGGRDRRVKVSDFGLATSAGDAVAGTLAGGTPRDAAGTPGYVAVEALGPGGADERSDQFSFCVALHEALHGERPFSARAAGELAAEVRRGPVAARRDVPRWLNRIVRRGLALAPADRYPSMRALIDDLRRTIAARRRRTLLAVEAAAAAAAVAATAYVVNARATTEAPPCSDAASELAGVWDPARRAAVTSAMMRAGEPETAASIERAVAAIDRYAEAWIAVRGDACEATEVRREQSPAMRDLRLACLDQARNKVRALGDALAAAGPDALRDAEATAAALPSLEACSDTAALRAQVRPPNATELTEAAGSKFDTRPAFRLPFSCGEAWQITPRADHAHPERQLDFMLPDGAPSAGYPVQPSAPGWVVEIVPGNGEVELFHGGGWFTTYRHMTDISVSLHQYVGRGHVIGRVGNVNAHDAHRRPLPAHLHYDQAYEPGVTNATFEHARRSGNMHPFLEGESINLSLGAQVRTSTNNCASGGTPGATVPFDSPITPTLFARTRPLLEIWSRRTRDNKLFASWYNQGWDSTPLRHVIAGEASIAVFEGDLHIFARKPDGTLFDLHYHPYGGWTMTELPGRVAGDPDAVALNWDRSLRVAARGADGYLYQWRSAGGDTWSQPERLGSVAVAGTPALFSRYDTLYVVARGTDGALRSWEWDRRGAWTEWKLAGAAADHPDISVDPRTRRVSVVARGPDHRLYRWQAKDPDVDPGHAVDGWGEPELVDATRTIAGAPAATIYRGALHIVARGPDNMLHHWWRDRTWQWEATGTTYLGNPDITQYGHQLQTTGRGPDGLLYTAWFDPIPGVWTQAEQGVAVAD